MNMTLEQMLAELLERLTAQIDAKDLREQFCSITVQPGNAVAFDFGDDCSRMAWVRLVSANPTASFPTAAAGLNNCALTLAYTVEVGIIGPAPDVENTMGEFVLPTEVEMFDASMDQAGELQMMYDAIRSAKIPEKVVGDYSPIGPEGGVLGGMWTVIVGGDD